MMFFQPRVLLACTLFFATSQLSSAAEVTVEKSDKGAVVKVDGKLFTEYVTRSNTKPILYPIVGPTGKEMTRAYPMEKEAREGERADHPHHRSFWFTHGDVNGLDFWAEASNRTTVGLTVHKKFVKLESGGPQAVIVADTDWTTTDGKKVLEDQRVLTFGADKDSRWIDFDITLKATEGDVKFGDTKEGTFGVRTAGSMKVDAKLGGKVVNSAGQTDKAAWGKQAPWVDYHGPVDGETLGIAIMNHPSSFRYPTYWHVRTYGLFTANPFGLHHFLGKPADEVEGAYTLPKGKSITLSYRVLFHKGDEKEGKIADAFAAYAKVKK